MMAEDDQFYIKLIAELLRSNYRNETDRSSNTLANGIFNEAIKNGKLKEDISVRDSFSSGDSEGCLPHEDGSKANFEDVPDSFLRQLLLGHVEQQRVIQGLKGEIFKARESLDCLSDQCGICRIPVVYRYIKERIRVRVIRRQILIAAAFAIVAFLIASLAFVVPDVSSVLQILFPLFGIGSESCVIRECFKRERVDELVERRLDKLVNDARSDRDALQAFLTKLK